MNCFENYEKLSLKGWKEKYGILKEHYELWKKQKETLEFINKIAKEEKKINEITERFRHENSSITWPENDAAQKKLIINEMNGIFTGKYSKDENDRKLFEFGIKLIEVFVLDEFFENAIDYNVALEKQKYFTKLENFTNDNLSALLQKKLSWALIFFNNQNY